MAEYHLDVSLCRETVASLDPFTLAYIEALFWTLTDDDGDPCDHLGLHDLSAEGLETCKADCTDFQQANAALLEGSDPRQAGHDFLLTRDGHGAGFWDRDPAYYPNDPKGKQLTAACKPYGEANAYIGDDGSVYVG